MLTLVIVGIVSGLITAISPCVLPVLPAILTSSLQDGARSRRRPLVVVGGLVASFAVFTLLGGILLSSLGLPDDLLRWAGIVTLAIVGVGLAIPAVGHILERPFQNTRLPRLNRDGNGFVMGLALGLVFVPCAGPILASITVLAATNGLSWGLVVLTLSFSIGIAIPLLTFGVAGQSIGSRIRAVRERLQTIRIASGVVLILTSLAIATNIAEPLQRLVPGTLAQIQERIENNDGVRGELDSLAGRDDQPAAPAGQLTFDECEEQTSDRLADCGPARDFEGIEAWLNTEGGAPLSLDGLEGQVVLLDFWTYSCINCQRTFPYLTAWDERYRDDGLTIVGVHSPEFSFEKVVSNVEDATARYGIEYPVAIDNNFDTWRAWDQRFWPAHYLIDQQGTVRQVHYGEGGYEETERLIQELLDAPAQAPVEADPGNHTQGRTPELYLGWRRLEYAQNEGIATDERETYRGTSTPELHHFSYDGTWTIEGERAIAGPDARLNLHFYAADVHLVLAGTGEVTVGLASESDASRTVIVDGTSDLYDLYAGDPVDDVMSIDVSEGVEVYAFTFG
ncbi:cytochrome c biogenesis protein DipZ [Demequina sp. TTPB684]|uniref:cytochrome c biogenesis protein DipZ n=1 Tax=unclassified Demequina TaxID=2620311 RepID=UPI001CF4C7FE|nr:MULTISPECIES: cytochrome c biogenesis protein DipZ [unclassified Demequina]MCB2413003.1 cytochrome c biogenesis protein DipZ [Demequina sp. TTPB684]UPU87072.1 cytochrome c biogenesis protein DipZ [Demequina sp. TMPB413]